MRRHGLTQFCLKGFVGVVLVCCAKTTFDVSWTLDCCLRCRHALIYLCEKGFVSWSLGRCLRCIHSEWSANRNCCPLACRSSARFRLFRQVVFVVLMFSAHGQQLYELEGWDCSSGACELSCATPREACLS